jgi:hypothetical protein
MVTSASNRVTSPKLKPTTLRALTNYQDRSSKPLTSFNPAQKTVAFLDDTNDVLPDEENDCPDLVDEDIDSDADYSPFSFRREAEEPEEYADDPLFATILSADTTAKSSSTSNNSAPLTLAQTIHFEAYQTMGFSAPSDVLSLSPSVLALRPDTDRVPPMLVKVTIATNNSVTTTTGLVDGGASQACYISKSLADMLHLEGRCFPCTSSATLADGTAKVKITEFVVLAVSIENPVTGEHIYFFAAYYVMPCAAPIIFGLPCIVRYLPTLSNDMIVYRLQHLYSSSEQSLLAVYNDHDQPLICVFEQDEYPDEPFDSREYLRNIGADDSTPPPSDKDNDAVDNKDNVSVAGDYPPSLVGSESDNDDMPDLEDNDNDDDVLSK